jgi:hypothetical protein
LALVTSSTTLFTLVSQAAILETISFVCVEVNLVDSVQTSPGNLTRDSTLLLCSLSLSSTYFSGNSVITLANEPSPTGSPPGTGKIGKVWKKFAPKVCTSHHIFLPMLFDLIAAKTIPRMSQIAIIFTRNHENTSSAHPKSNPFMLRSRQSFATLKFCDPSVVAVNLAHQFVGHQDLMLVIRVVIKTSDMLRAKTVMTGAKMTLMTFSILK